MLTELTLNLNTISSATASELEYALRSNTTLMLMGLHGAHSTRSNSEHDEEDSLATTKALLLIYQYVSPSD